MIDKLGLQKVLNSYIDYINYNHECLNSMYAPGSNELINFYTYIKSQKLFIVKFYNSTTILFLKSNFTKAMSESTNKRYYLNVEIYGKNMMRKVFMLCV